MKAYYDNNAECIVYTCPHCNHIYHEYYDYKKRTENQEKPFLILDDKLLYFKPRDYAEDEAKRLYHYACPNCGILQIDVSDT